MRLDVQRAAAVLKNKIERLEYDLNCYGKSTVAEGYPHVNETQARAELMKLRKAEATEAVDNLKIRYEHSLRIETRINGLVIETALYGNLAPTKSSNMGVEGQVIDVEEKFTPNFRQQSETRIFRKLAPQSLKSIQKMFFRLKIVFCSKHFLRLSSRYRR